MELHNQATAHGKIVAAIVRSVLIHDALPELTKLHQRSDRTGARVYLVLMAPKSGPCAPPHAAEAFNASPHSEGSENRPCRRRRQRLSIDRYGGGDEKRTQSREYIDLAPIAAEASSGGLYPSASPAMARRRHDAQPVPSRVTQGSAGRPWIRILHRHKDLRSARCSA
jgi:hypothetical protein